MRRKLKQIRPPFILYYVLVVVVLLTFASVRPTLWGFAISALFGWCGGDLILPKVWKNTDEDSYLGFILIVVVLTAFVSWLTTYFLSNFPYLLAYYFPSLVEQTTNWAGTVFPMNQFYAIIVITCIATFLAFLDASKQGKQ